MLGNSLQSRLNEALEQLGSLESPIDRGGKRSSEEDISTTPKKVSRREVGSSSAVDNSVPWDIPAFDSDRDVDRNILPIDSYDELQSPIPICDDFWTSYSESAGNKMEVEDQRTSAEDSSFRTMFEALRMVMGELPIDGEVQTNSEEDISSSSARLVRREENISSASESSVPLDIAAFDRDGEVDHNTLADDTYFLLVDDVSLVRKEASTSKSEYVESLMSEESLLSLVNEESSIKEAVPIWNLPFLLQGNVDYDHGNTACVCGVQPYYIENDEPSVESELKPPADRRIEEYRRKEKSYSVGDSSVSLDISFVDAEGENSEMLATNTSPLMVNDWPLKNEVRTLYVSADSPIAEESQPSFINGEFFTKEDSVSILYLPFNLQGDVDYENSISARDNEMQPDYREAVKTTTDTGLQLPAENYQSTEEHLDLDNIYSIAFVKLRLTHEMDNSTSTLRAVLLCNFIKFLKPKVNAYNYGEK